MRPYFGLLTLVLVGTSFALDLRLNDGVVLTDIRLRGKNDRGITVQHRDGISGVDYMKMQLADALTLGFDEAKYQASLKSPTTLPLPAEKPKASALQPGRPSRLYESPTAPAPPALDDARASTPAATSARQQCAATTKKGFQCSRMAQPGRSYCYQHP